MREADTLAAHGAGEETTMATIIQSTFTARNDIATAGSFSEAYDDRRITTRIARGLQLAGMGTFKVPGVHGQSGGSFVESCGQAFQSPTPVAAVDVDAIVTTHASSASILTLSGASLNGLIGAGAMQPARLVTVTTSTHADFDVGTVAITGINALTNQPTTETLAMADGGGQTLTTTTYFSSVSAVVMSAQAGVAGSFTVGVPALASLTVSDLLGIVVREPIKTGVFASNLYGYPGFTATGAEGNYVDGEPFNVITKGGIWVITEEAVNDQDPIYVRVAAGAGGSVLGQFRNDADTASCVLVPGRFTRKSAAGLAPAYINLLG